MRSNQNALYNGISNTDNDKPEVLRNDRKMILLEKDLNTIPASSLKDP